MVDLIDKFSTKQKLDPMLVETYHNNNRGNWEHRVNEFLYFCLDGGVTNYLFDFENILNIMIEFKTNSYIVDLKAIIYTLLNIKKDPFIGGEKIKTSFTGDKSKINSLSYNENLLCKIIKFYDINLVFDLDNETQELEFYNYILENNYSYKLLSISFFCLF